MPPPDNVTAEAIKGQMWTDPETGEIWIFLSPGEGWILLGGTASPGELSGISFGTIDPGEWVYPDQLTVTIGYNTESLEKTVAKLEERVQELERHSAAASFAFGRIWGTCSELMKHPNVPGVHKLMAELSKIAMDYYEHTRDKQKRDFNPDRFKGIIEDEE